MAGIEKWMISDDREPYRTLTALTHAGYKPDVNGWWPAISGSEQIMLWGKALTGKRKFKLRGSDLIALRKVGYGQDFETETIPLENIMKMNEQFEQLIKELESDPEKLLNENPAIAMALRAAGPILMRYVVPHLASAAVNIITQVLLEKIGRAAVDERLKKSMTTFAGDLKFDPSLVDALKRAMQASVEGMSRPGPGEGPGKPV